MRLWLLLGICFSYLFISFYLVSYVHTWFRTIFSSSFHHHQCHQREYAPLKLPPLTTYNFSQPRSNKSTSIITMMKEIYLILTIWKRLFPRPWFCSRIWGRRLEELHLKSIQRKISHIGENVLCQTQLHRCGSHLRSE